MQLKHLYFAFIVLTLMAPTVMAQNDPGAGDDKKADKKPAEAPAEAVAVPAKAAEPEPLPATPVSEKGSGQAADKQASGTAHQGTRSPHGRMWDGGRYGSTSWWADMYVGAGMSTLQVNAGVAKQGGQMAPSISVGAKVHASHLIALTADVSLQSVSLSGDALLKGWSSYTVQNTLVTLGAKVTPWAHEFCSLGFGAHVGINQFSSSIDGDAGAGSWSGPELVVGGTLDVSYFPFHALEVGLNVRVDALLGGENTSELEWEGSGAPSSLRTIMGAGLSAAFHF